MVDSEHVVLVTGGAGYIGSHTAKRLSRAGYRVVVYDNLAAGHRRAVRWGPLEEGDILDGECLSHVLSKYSIQAVLHFAGLASVEESMRYSERYFRNNVTGTLCLLDAMRTARVRTLIFSSTCAVYGVPAELPIWETAPTNPTSAYGESKLMIEKILNWEGICHGLSWVALRYFNAAGCDQEGETGEDHSPETHLIPTLFAAAKGLRPACQIFGTDYPTPDGTCVRDYVHVTDLAEAHVQALSYLENGGPSIALNLGTGAGYSVRQIVDAAELIAKQRIPVECAPRRAGDPPTLVASPVLANRALGWKAECSSLEHILETAWRWASRRD